MGSADLDSGNPMLPTKKKSWNTPAMIVLVRGGPEEAVLTGCKVGLVAGPSTNANDEWRSRTRSPRRPSAEHVRPRGRASLAGARAVLLSALHDGTDSTRSDRLQSPATRPSRL